VFVQVFGMRALAVAAGLGRTSIVQRLLVQRQVVVDATVRLSIWHECYLSLVSGLGWPLRTGLCCWNTRSLLTLNVIEQSLRLRLRFCQIDANDFHLLTTYHAGATDRTGLAWAHGALACCKLRA
jgi:hypothetical protein